LFGTDKRTPWGKKIDTDWSTSTKSHFKEANINDEIPSAGGGHAATAGANASDPKLAFSQKNSRMTPAQYRGIQKSDDEITEMFRQKLLQRGARGILGMQRVFKILDDNGSGTLDI